MPNVNLFDAARWIDTDTPPFPRALVGLDADQAPVWWSPTEHGNLATVSTAAMGRTTLLKSLVAQLVKLSPAPGDVLVPAGRRRSSYAAALADVGPLAPDAADTDPRIGHWAVTVVDGVGGRQWWDLEAAAEDNEYDLGDVHVVPATDPAALADALENLAQLVRLLTYQRRTWGGPTAVGPYRFLVLDAPHLFLERLDAPAADHLACILADGPGVGVYTVDAHGPGRVDLPSSFGLVAVSGLDPASIRRLRVGPVPEFSTRPRGRGWDRGRWAVRDLRDQGPWQRVQGVHVPVGPGRDAGLADFFAL